MAVRKRDHTRIQFESVPKCVVGYRIPGERVFKLKEPDADGRWVFELSGTIAIRFNVEDDSTVSGLTFYRGNKEDVLPKVAAKQDLPDASRDPR